MLAIAIIAALVAAAMNASSGVLQRRATGQVDPKRLFHSDIISEVIRNKLWITGVGLQVAAFFAEALALSRAPLVLVVPLSATSLVFLLFILHYFTSLRVGPREWVAVIAIAGGVSGLLAIANPQGGHVPVDAVKWMVFLAAGLIAISLGAIAMRRAPGHALRGALGGATAGLHFAYTAAATKLVLSQMHLGVGHLFTSWELYVLLVVGVSSALSMQSMYAAGPLTFSQPALEIVEDMSGIFFGILMFGDSVSLSAAALAGQSISAAIMITGIILLAGSRRLHQGNKNAGDTFVLKHERLGGAHIL